MTRLALLAMLAACTDETEPERVTFATEIAPALRQACATCHTHTAPAGNLALDGTAADLIDNLVGQPSTASTLLLVEPGDPDRSFVVLKLTASFEQAACIGDCGFKMPLQGSLDPTVLDRLVDWISLGCP